MPTLDLRAALSLVGHLAAAAVLLVLAPPALACPYCRDGAARAEAVNAGIFDGNFWGHAFTLALPFLLVGAVGAVVYRRGGRG